MKRLHITCENLEQRQQVFDVLDGMGYKPFGAHGNYLDIQTCDDGDYMTTVDHDTLFDSDCITFTQFMEQYNVNKLNQLIEQATTTLKISKSELSRRIKRSRNYLGEVQRRGASTQLQAELCEDIQAILNGGTVLTDAEIIADLSEKLEDSRHLANKYLEDFKARDADVKRLTDEVYSTAEKAAELEDKYQKSLGRLAKSTKNNVLKISELRQEISVLENKLFLTKWLGVASTAVLFSILAVLTFVG